MIDLHVHSTASDGSNTPTEVMELAAEAGLEAVALTDHDTVGGIPEFLANAPRFPQLEVIPGVELSCLFSNREIHMVGLFIDHTNERLTAFLEDMRQKRQERNELIRLKLNTLGYPLSWNHPALAAGGDTASVGRPHFARALMEDYDFPSMQSVFDKLLKRGCPAYVQRTLPDPAKVLDVIHAAGGVTVWAHPVYRQRNERAWVRRIMKRFAPLGLDAAEAYYALFGPAETQMITELAGIYGLALSGGSDFHGDNTPTLRIGTGAGKLHVPASLLPHLREKLALIRASCGLGTGEGASPLP